MLKLKLLLTGIFCLFIVAAQSQVSGVVVNAADNSPLQGASVVVASSKAGAKTDAAGKFSVVAKSGDQLTVSMVGFESSSVTVGDNASLTISLKQSAASLSEVIVSVGSRNTRRTITDAPLPIDIFSAKDLGSTAQATFDKALQYRVPSFNTVQTPVNDASALMDPYEIRNMGPSRTLVLINGKRKNTSALMYIQTSPGVGESGADISAIPTAAIKRVEILRDGASAQYGSDAIAGVMNIILKDKNDAGAVTVNTGITHKGDGETFGMTVNNGGSLGKGGFLNYTVNLQKVGQVSRSGIVDAAGEASDFGATLSEVQAFLKLKPDAGNINGAPKTTAAKFLVNGAVPTGENGEFYFNGAFVYKKVNSYANYRTPYWRPTDYGLLHTPGTPYLGYVPTFDGDLNDYNGTIGLKGEKNGWNSDISFTTGGNTISYMVTNSVNRDLGTRSPTTFRPGGYEFSHHVGNIDISKSVSDAFTVSFGSEFRAETFNILAGDTASYHGRGSDSFAGMKQENSGKSTRFNFGSYLDLAYDFSSDFLVNATVRTEDYSDFGNAFVWKLSSRYKLNDGKATIRGSLSTGFKAPSLHQIYTQIVNYSFVPGQGIQLSGIVNNVSPQAYLLGVKKLSPEKSNNFTLGFGYNPSPRFSMTLDYYNIKVKDRIVLSSRISKGSTPASAPLNAILDQSGVGSVSFMINGINTSTSGLDFVFNYRNSKLGNGNLNWSLAGNYTISNELDKDGGINNPTLIKNAGQSIFNYTQEYLLLSSRPKYKAILGADYTVNKWNINFNNTLFGPTQFRNDGMDQNLKVYFIPKVVTDLGFGYKFSDKVAASFSVLNLLNVTPKWEFRAMNSAGETLLKSAAEVKNQSNLITFNQRYDMVTYDGSHFSQHGTILQASLTVNF